MKMDLKGIILIAVLVMVKGTVMAQADSSEKKLDSLNAFILQEYNKKMKEINQQRVIDSMKQVKLEQELSSLKTTDNLRKEELQKQIQEIKDKEANQILQKKARIDSLRQTVKGFPVEGFFNDTLFLIYNRSGGFSAKERAEAISKRIKNIAIAAKFNADSLKLSEGESAFEIVYGENILMSISDNDAIWNNSSKQELAQKNLQIISRAIKQYKEEINPVTLAKEIALALLVLLLMGVIIYFVIKFFKWGEKRIQQQEGKRFKGLKIRNYTLLDATKEVNFVLNINTFLKWVIIVLIIYIALPILFGIFPWTENFAQTLFGYILNPVKSIATALWNYLPSLITIIVIVFIFRYVLNFLYYLRLEIERGKLHLPGFYADWANPTYQIIRVLIIAFMLVVIFPYLPGSDSPVFKGVSVFLGFLFTFGSAGSLSNIVSGLVLTYMRLFKIGDRVKIADVTGDVIEKSLLVTRIRTTKNEIISIPNSTIMNSPTINYSSDAQDKGLIMYTTVTIGYDVPWRDMHQALIDAALRCDLVLKEPAPFVLQTSLDDFYVSYQINLYTREANSQAFIYSELHKHIQDVCNERGIEIMSPHYRSERDGNMSTIPPSYLPKEYKAPGFNLTIKKDQENV
jgi:small-conductance mechanosensitive channel